MEQSDKDSGEHGSEVQPGAGDNWANTGVAHLCR